MTDKNEAIERTKLAITGVKERIDNNRAVLHDLEKQLADLLTEFKVGERVMWCGKEYEITGYSLYYGNVRYYGSKIKKDGVPSSLIHEMYEGVSSTITRKPA